MLVHAADRIRSLFLEGRGARPIVLLGAGASKKSGIPLSNEIVEIAAKWTYCQAHGRHPDDPDIKRSDWLGWLRGHAWYRSDLGQAENYSSVIQNLLQPRENRKEFFLRLITPNVPASTGYHRLLDLMGERRIETVLTTNFDQVLPDLQVMRRRPHHLEVIRTPGRLHEAVDISHTSAADLSPWLGRALHGQESARRSAAPRHDVGIPPSAPASRPPSTGDRLPGC